MDINIIGVPMKYGCGRDGVDKGPDKLRELDIVKYLSSTRNKVYDIGDVFVPQIQKDEMYKDNKTMKYYNTILRVNEVLADKVYLSLTEDKFPFIMGGDHSLSIGSIAGVSSYYKKIAVIWIDAHADMNTPETSPSGNIHGMPLAISMGFGDKKMTDLYVNKTKVSTKDVYIIGARDLDDGEIELSKEHDISLFKMDDIRKITLETVLKRVIDNINRSDVDAVHLSFDLDSVDGDLAPGTGTPVKGGLSLGESKFILKTILKEGFVKSMDFVELNPRLDINDTTSILTVDLLKTISKYI